MQNVRSISSMSPFPAQVTLLPIQGDVIYTCLLVLLIEGWKRTFPSFPPTCYMYFISIPKSGGLFDLKVTVVKSSLQNL